MGAVQNCCQRLFSLVIFPRRKYQQTRYPTSIIQLIAYFGPTVVFHSVTGQDSAAYSKITNIASTQPINAPTITSLG